MTSSEAREARLQNGVLVAILTAAAALYAVFIARTAFRLAGITYFTLIDDAMVSMRYAQHLAVHTHLFPGLDDVLRELESRGVPWGIVTNKPSIYTLPLLDALQLRARCASVVCPDQVTHTKPHPEPMYKACAEMGVDAARCVYVGDHERDIAAGRNAGMLTVAAAWGYVLEGETALDWEADRTVDTVFELSRLLGVN